MARLIDADKLRHRLLCQPPRSISINFVLELVSTMPTVDAEPVRHGHWIVDRLASTGGGSYTVYQCSECHGTAIVAYKRCPNCEAKMDESNEQLDERGEDADSN